MQKYKNQLIATIGLIGIIGIFYMLTIRTGHNWGGDFSLYIHHAENIATGQPYGNTGYILNPHYTPLLSPQDYPPVFPLLLSPVYKAFGMNLNAMKIEIIIIFMLAMLTIFFVFKQKLRPIYTLALLGLVGFNPYFWDIKNSVLSDLPFLLFFYLSILFIERTYSLQEKKKIYYSILVGLLTYLAYGTRGIGLIIIPSILLYEILKFRRITRVFLISTAVFVVLVLFQKAILGNHTNYIKYFSLSPKLIINHIVHYSASMSAFWANGYSKSLRILFFALLILAALFGYVWRFRHQYSILEIVIIVYPLPLLFFPGTQGPRYLMPLFPIFIFYVFIGLQNINLLQNQGKQKTVFATLLGLALISYGGRYTRMDFGPFREGINKPESIQLFNFIRKNTDKNAIFIFRKPRPLALFTDRKAAVYQRTPRAQEIWDFFKQIHANYVVVNRKSSSDHKYLLPALNKHATCLKQVYKNPDFTVFRIKKPTDCRKD